MFSFFLSDFHTIISVVSKSGLQNCIQIVVDRRQEVDSLGNCFWEERIKILQNSEITDCFYGRSLSECNQALQSFRVYPEESETGGI